MIRILHLFSNHKVTGPAELALDTALEASRSSAAAAVECRFIAGRHPRDPLWLGDLARQRGANLVQIEGLKLPKHFNPWRWYRDGKILRRYLEKEPADILHCHMPNDHLTAALAVRGLTGEKKVPIVRTLYAGEAEPDSWRARRTLRRACDRLICFSRAVLESLRDGPLQIPAAGLSRLEPPIDTERFSPDRKPRLADFRKAQGIAAGDFVVGIVARMQTHRRFEVFLEAMRLVSRRLSNFRFVIIGRGTHQEKVARDPVRRLGLEKEALFAGYLTGDDYVAALLSFDLKVFLVPGSDGTCRAVREALSAGVPVVAARRGMLPEIVRAGVTGEVIEDTAPNLAQTILDLAADRARLEAMAVAARREALERFSYRRYTDELHELYRQLLRR
jgi:glycosyltransferase involved in cell wall biosynthesis